MAENFTDMKSHWSEDLGDNKSQNSVEKKVAAAKATKGSLYYPSDLQGGRFYPEQMKISIYEREGVSLTEVQKVATEHAQAFIDSGNKPAKEKGEDAAAKNKNKPKLGGAVLGGLKAVGGVFVKGVKARQGQNTKLIREIYLPMPKELSHAEGVSWQASDLGSIGGFMKGDMDAAAAATVLSKAALGTGGAAGGVIGAIFGNGAAGAIGGFLASDNLQKSLESAVGIKANPFKEQTFEGIEFRKFSFSYTFNPKNQTEIKDLRSIITDIRAYSKPSFRSGGGIFNYPHEFYIEFLTRDQNGNMITNPHVPELKYCVCSNVTTNFAGKEWRAFAGGAPVEISLQMDFEETELITQNDVLGKTTVGRFKNNKGSF